MRPGYFWLLPVIFWTLVVGLSFNWNLKQLQRQVSVVAMNQGRDIFRMIEAMRLWNAQHGGIYVIQSEQTPPNPYLDVPERDPVTVSGKRLTMVNPAYMTRQMAKTIAEQTGIVVHITSLKPINPGNRADAWEAETLTRFEHGLRERGELFEGPDRLARYMAPLTTREPCLQCHRHQGYKVGDIRGGISVSFSAVAIESSIAPHRQAVIVGHLVVWVALVALSIFAMARIRAHIAALERARAEQEKLVEQRTAELRIEAAERQQAEQQLRHLVDASSGGIVGISPEGVCLFANRVAAEMFGVEQPSALHGELITLRLFRMNPRLVEMLTRTLAGEHQLDDAVVLELKPDQSLTVEVHMDPITERSQLVGVVVTLVDATARQARQMEVWRQANFDHLTGLANRSLFLDRLAHSLMLEARTGRLAAVFFMDLDGFKPVNDQHGHAAGDEVLVVIARRLQECTRDGDIVARFGGDEFVLGLTEIASERDVSAMADKVLEAVSQPVTLSSRVSVSVSGSIGIALYPADSQDTEELIADADAAMYRAKAAGKRCYCYFNRGDIRCSE